MNRIMKAAMPAVLALAVSGCGRSAEPAENASEAGETKEAATGDPMTATLSAQQIADGLTVVWIAVYYSTRNIASAKTALFNGIVSH